jgi:hypothetical protein
MVIEQFRIRRIPCATSYSSCPHRRLLLQQTPPMPIATACRDISGAIRATANFQRMSNAGCRHPAPMPIVASIPVRRINIIAGMSTSDCRLSRYRGQSAKARRGPIARPCQTAAQAWGCVEADATRGASFSTRSRHLDAERPLDRAILARFETPLLPGAGCAMKPFDQGSRLNR